MNIDTQAASGRPWYVTTSIPYVNAQPHIGHALESIQADVLARYQRLAGRDVRFLTGTDENSLKNVRAAEREGIPVQALVERNAAQFYALRDPLELSFDDFIRTSAEPRHAEGVRKLWEACARNGDIYKRAYSGLYCVGCEQFYTEDELVDGVCPEHLAPPELVEEENYFFRLSRYAQRLRALIESDQLRIEPRARKNEVLSFIRGGLSDVSISRSRLRARSWGIPVPGDPEQVTYVWFDALGNYITALGYAADAPDYQRYWLGSPDRVHVIGKNIIRFHAINWPAMLLAAGVPLPTAVYVHGFVTVDGRKIGKSLGNVVDPVALAEQYGSDALRYYLLREIPSTGDGDFSLERLARSYNADLADQLGNLLSRTVAMVGRYFAGVAPAPGAPHPADQALLAAGDGLFGRIDAAIGRFALGEALAEIWNLVALANKYVVEVKPWDLAKCRGAGPEAAEAELRLRTTLYNLLEVLRLAAHGLAAFLPATAEAIAGQLGVTIDSSKPLAEALAWGGYAAGTAVRPGEVLFPKLELASASLLGPADR
ncbi:MAG TPA: methionine--tRNA ligase [Roseiflexaceae bacterium]|nr:methionine--tRNA ligase [Roseiflexaceae bacterium]